MQWHGFVGRTGSFYNFEDHLRMSIASINNLLGMLRQHLVVDEIVGALCNGVITPEIVLYYTLQNTILSRDHTATGNWLFHLSPLLHQQAAMELLSLLGPHRTGYQHSSPEFQFSNLLIGSIQRGHTMNQVQMVQENAAHGYTRAGRIGRTRPRSNTV